MGINVNTSQQQVTASVNDETVSATVSAGFGASGAPGAAATIAVGTVTTGAAGSQATVTNVGSSSAAVFDFTIPAGATGPQGATGPAGTTTWAGITDKPTTFTPNAHTHAISDVTNLSTTLSGINSAISGKVSTGSAASFLSVATDDGANNTWTISGTTLSYAYYGSVTFRVNGSAITSGVWQGSAVDVAYGGTGATTAADARTNLGAAALSHQHSATADLTFAGATAGQVLTVNSGATALVWATPTTYTLPASTTTTLGGVIVPTSGGLTVDGSGNISAGFATAAQAAACTNATTVLSPARFQDAQLAWVQIDAGTYGASTTASGGQTAIAQLQRYFATSATANGSCVWRSVAGSSSGWNVGTSATYITQTAVDWSKPRAFQMRLTTDGTYSTNTILRVQWGKDSTTTTLGQMANHGIGFEVRNKRVWLTTHNGTSLSAVDSGFDLSTNYYSTYDFLVTSDGAGNVALFINGTQQATSTGGPTAASTTVTTGFTTEVSNGGDATNCVFRFRNYVWFLVGR